METESLPEAALNPLLRRADWRFLLHGEALPRSDDSPDAADRLRPIANVVPTAPGTASLVELARPLPWRLPGALAALRPGGELHFRWWLPLPAGPRLIRRRLERAGFCDVRVHWRWPPLGPVLPQLWLPADAPRAAFGVLALRPARSRGQRRLRRVWSALARAGLLAPLDVLARRPGPAPGDELAQAIDAPAASWALLTGGRRSINKVVGLPFGAGAQPPPAVVKFARTAAAEAGLEREARVLRTLAHELPAAPGVPRLLAVGRRAGRMAIAETSIHGEPLIARLAPERFDDLSRRVTQWLEALAPSCDPQPREEWWERLVERPLAGLQQRFGAALRPGTVDRARELLRELPDLPRACEHRDCSPWNVVLTASGAPALLDWESAEPHGLPLLDLVYFLSNAVFVMDRALESGRTRPSYARLLDGETPEARVAGARLAEYTRRLRLDPAALPRLRLLCWIVHTRSDFEQFRTDAGGPPSAAALRRSMFLGLVEEELRRTQ